MNQSTFLNQCKRAHRNAIITRVVMFFIYSALTIVCMLSFATFGWTAANMDAPITEGLAPAVWTASMAIVEVICLIACLYFTTKALDELFFAPNDIRRMLRKKR